MTILRFILFSAFPVILFGQDKSTILSVRPHYGFIIKHSGKLSGLTDTKPFGIEINTTWQLMDETSWQYCYCYPRVGLTFNYSNFANPEILGSSFALFPYVEPQINGGEKISGFIKFGIGPVFLSNVFDSVYNPQNKFFSTHISFIVQMALGLHFRINEKINLRFTGDFNHISNGGIKNPNLGINYPTLGFGAEYVLNPLPYLERNKDKNIRLVPYNQRFDFLAFGTGKTAVKGQERYPVMGFTALYSYVFGRQQGVSAAIEYTFDYADREEIRKLSLNDNLPVKDHKYLAINAGHELLLGKFNFYQQLGYYLYSPFKRRDRLYQRYGLKLPHKIN
ncbi:MAG: acyloxyacyl hydrolase [Bacteroidales bacterium]|nr:acyloxyacyl hydrolase [Bacteroidales bacterium]